MDFDKQYQYSASRMAYFDSLPEDIQELSRQHGAIIDEMHKNKFTKKMMEKRLKLMGRL